VHYLNETSTDVIPQLTYLSYPRDEAFSDLISVTPPVGHLLLEVYLAHLIHTNPDFDQIVHGTIALHECHQSHKRSSIRGDALNVSVSKEFLLDAVKVGGTWSIESRENNVKSRLQGGDAVHATLVHKDGRYNAIKCPIHLMEELHCVTGPAFGPTCEPLPMSKQPQTSVDY
jgi:hypothetical protein